MLIKKKKIKNKNFNAIKTKYNNSHLKNNYLGFKNDPVFEKNIRFIVLKF